MELRSKGERSEDTCRSVCSSVSKTAAKIVLQSAELRQSVEESVKKTATSSQRPLSGLLTLTMITFLESFFYHSRLGF